MSERPPSLVCYSCRAEYPTDSLQWKCGCGGVLDVGGLPIFAREALSARPNSFWRYHEALGLKNLPEVTLGEITTPLLPVVFRGVQMTLKLEYVMPTGSYKDRGIALCINQLASQGVRHIAEDSSGNAGASTAAYSAAAGIQANIFVPAKTSASKVNQIRMYGAECHSVPGPRPESTKEAQRPREGVQYIGHSWNPWFACGIKSIAYEIAEQYNWTPPDWIAVPCGGGSLVMGIIDGFNDLLAAGFVSRAPRLLVVQSAACDPIYRSWVEGAATVTPIVPKDSLAEGVSLPAPIRGNQVLDAIRRHDCKMVRIDDEELLSCWKDMARRGVYMEPTSAIIVAGAWKACDSLGFIGKEEKVLAVVTGHGLKTKPSCVELALADP